MRKLLLALTLLAIAPRLSTAQEAKVAVVAEKVTYSRAVPKALRAFVPRGGKSRFWGATKLKYNGQLVWVHVYDVQKTIFPKGKTNLEGLQTSELDLFVLSASGILTRVSSVPFSYLRYGGYDRGGDFETVDIKTLWLDYNTKKRPVIWLCLENPNGFQGPIASCPLITFEQGFKKFVVQNEFSYGNYSFHSTIVSFAVNRKSELNVIFGSSDINGASRIIYRWEENLFRPFEKQTKLSNETKYRSVPLTPP